MATIACGHEEHREHLCQMVALETPVEELKPKVRNAKYICRFCGRAAAQPESLCKPEPLG